MDPVLLVSAPKTSSCIGVLPSFLSYKSSPLQRPRLCFETRLSVSTKRSERTPFLGDSVVSGERNDYLNTLRTKYVRLPPIRAAVKRRKEIPLDNVIQRDKKLKLVLKIRKILLSQPDRVMPLHDLGRYRKALGLQKNRRFIALLKKFPAVFQIVEEGAYSLRFTLSPEAERLYLEEMKVRNEMEDLLVVKLRKLLMMSAEKRILLEKIGHLRTDLGLPLEFRDTICQRYPQYFKVVETARGSALELTLWDPELAVSAAELAEEENQARELEERNLIIDRPPKFNRVKLPKGLQLSKGEMRKIAKFRDIPYISPYSDFSGLRSGTLEKEKHASGVVHEILSLTVEKRTLVDHLTHFREEFRFSQQLRGMIIRHPDMFYVSLKGDRDSVFLREAYQDSQLVEKDKLLLIKEKIRALVNVPRFPRDASNSERGSKEGTDQREDGSGEEEEECSDIDNLGSDGFDDEEEDFEEGGDDYEDDWSEEDDIPPDFDEDGGYVKLGPIKPTKQINVATKNGDKVLVPVFPDGRQRECW